MIPSRRRKAILFLIAGVALFASQAIAADKKPKEAAKPAMAAPVAQPEYDSILKGLRFREIGPATMGGRIDDFAVVESNPDIVYVGAASGGVFKTQNGGTTWEPIFDNEATSTIGAVTVAPSDPSIVWVGTGEANNRQSSSWGNGVYKSTDAGKTWQHMGLAETHHIGRIVIHPSDPNIVYVAAVGRLWGPSKDRGVYKTTDGGKTWNNVLFVNEDTGVTDIALDQESPGTLIAASYQRRRTVFGFNGGGPGSGLYKTTDGGATWKKLEKGLPWDPSPRPAPQPGGGGFGGGGGGGGGGGFAALLALQQQQQQAATPPPPPEAIHEIGRIGVTFYRRNTNIVYALIEHAAGGIFRSDDKGETWTKMSDTNPRAIYYSQVHIDPNNDQRIWVHGAQMFYSDDGGRTFRQNVVQRIHGDFHAMWIDPHDSNHIITGSDGGIYFSRDRGHSWDFVNTIPLGQFYEIGLDMAKPYHICGGLQDNNAWCGPSATMDARGIANSDWFTVGGGDGFYAQIDPTDPNIVYAESQDGNVLRRNLVTHESRLIRPLPPEGEHYRFQWNSPIVVSAHDHNTIYYGGNYLFKSTNRGDDWVRLGPDLTTGVDRDKQPIFGKVPDRFTLSRHDGVQEWPAITTVSESPVNKDVIYVGTDDGNLQVTRDGGKTWKNVADRAKGVPKGTYVSRVLASRHAEGTAYATFDGHRGNDFNVYVFATTDYGDTWKPIRNGLPDDNGTVHVIREHFRNPKLLFAGTEHGLYTSFDQGAHWTRLKLNLPTVPVDDIAIHPRDNDLVLATHGRSIWILDDITPLEQMSDSVPAEDLHLFDLRPATEWRIANRGGNTGHKLFLGPNPPNGAVIQYYLKSKPGERERVRIAITDKDGKAVRDLDGTKEAGLNRVVWDLRLRSPIAAAAAAAAPSGGEQGEAAGEAGGGGFGGGFGGFGFGGGGGALRVEPGEYTVKITVGNNTQTKKVTVEEDPRINLSADDRAARHQALTQLSQMMGTATVAQRSMTGMHTSLSNFIEAWKRPGAAKPPENVQKATEDLLKRTDETCRKFASAAQCGDRGPGLGNAGPPLVYTPPAIPQRIGQVMGGLEGFTSAPTATQLEQIKLLQGMLTDAAAAARKLAQEDLPALNKMMNDAGVPHIVVPGGNRGGAAGAGGDPSLNDDRDP
jgi:photosystem II stability/assembly factor-like uncharacterized protein